MPATRSRTSTEGAEQVVDTDKKIVDDVVDSGTTEVEEVKEKAVIVGQESEAKEESNDESSDSTGDESKPVDDSAENGSNIELKSDANGDNNVENGSSKRKSTGGEGDNNGAADTTDVTPKKAKLDAPVVDETNGSDQKNGGNGEQADEAPAAPVETSA